MSRVSSRVTRFVWIGRPGGEGVFPCRPRTALPGETPREHNQGDD